MKKLMILCLMMMATTTQAADYRHDCRGEVEDDGVQCVCDKLDEALDLAGIECEVELQLMDQYCAIGNNALGAYSCRPVVDCGDIRYEFGYHGSLCGFLPVREVSIERVGYWWTQEE